MSKDWTLFNVKYFAIPMTSLVFGLVIGFSIANSKKKPTKHYPIEVRCHWETSQSSYYPTMEADSVKGDTIWKDGNRIVNKNIKNVLFKQIMKTELEEIAASKWPISGEGAMETFGARKLREAFIGGAQWQQEQILQFLYSEIIERRPYSSSKMCEEVINFIERFNNKKI